MLRFLIALCIALCRWTFSVPGVRTKPLRFTLAVLVGLVAWLLYLRLGLPVVQDVNGRDPLVFQSVLLLLSVGVLGVVIQRRLATRRRVPRRRDRC